MVIVPAGQTLMIPNPLRLLNIGYFIVDGVVFNHGTIDNSNLGTIVNHGAIGNNNLGTIVNNGTITICTTGVSISVTDGTINNIRGTIINATSGTITIGKDPGDGLGLGRGMFRNHGGNLTNHGSINIDLTGEIDNNHDSIYAVFNNTGIVNNYGQITNNLSNINNTGIIATNHRHYGTNVGGSIANYSNLNNNDGGNITINNYGSFTNAPSSDTINNSGGIITIKPGGTLRIGDNSRFLNDAGSNLTINSGGIINNEWIDTGNSEKPHQFFVSTNSTYTQNGTFNGIPPVSVSPPPAPTPAPTPDPNVISITTIANLSEYYMTLNESTEIPQGHTLTLPEFYTFVIPVGKTLTNNGTIITTAGHISNHGVFTNNGAVNLNNNRIAEPNAPRITNDGGTINNNGVFSNFGFNIYSSGIFNNNVGGTITNTSVSGVGGNLNLPMSSGQFANSGSIIMNANTTFVVRNANNNSGGTILINTGGTFTLPIHETFRNNAQSTLTINQGGTINNLGDADNRFYVSTNSTYTQNGTLIGPAPLIVS
jgi:hypothetical protein